MNDLIQAGQHPDADQLNAFVEHALPAHEQQQTMAHLAGCPACRQVVALSLPPEDERQTEVVRRRWFSRWAWAGIPALAAVILVAFLVRNSERTVRQTPAPAQMAETRPLAPPSAPAESAPPENALAAAPLRQRLKQNRALAGAKQPPVGQRELGVVSGSAGGVLGGIGASPTQPPAQAAPSSASSGGPLTSLAADRLQSGFSRPSPLPSRLAMISMCSRASDRLAIDTQNHLFFSDDEGRSWKAVPSPWKGRAVAVALASGVSNGHAPPVPEMSPAVMTGTPALSGSLAGAIKDTSGAVIPGATVFAVHSGGSSVRSVTTDSQGRFRIEDLAPGSYRVEAQAPGFLAQSFAAEVTPSQQAVADVALHPASVSQSVAVQTTHSPLDNAFAATKAAPSQTLSLFVLTTDDGERWASTDGQSWTRE
jgi:hypothetical protein